MRIKPVWICPCVDLHAYLLSVTDFYPKGTTSEVRVHAGTLFGRTGCWSIAKCSWFSTKLSRSFDRHGKTTEELQKKSFEKWKKTPVRPRRSVRKIDEYVIFYTCEDASVNFSNGKSVTWEMFARGRWDAPTRTSCVYRVILCRSGEGRGRLTIVCGVPRPTARGGMQQDRESLYSAFRQKFPKLWTSVAHSFLQQIAQNKNWAHPKATTLPRICKVEMQQASLLYYSAKPQSGGILGCALVCPTSLYVRTIRSPTFCRSLPSVGAYSQYPAWSGRRRSADVLRADHDRVGSSPWQGGFKERVYCACLPSICLIFSTCKYAATAFNFKHKKTINVTDLSWPKTFRYRF